MDALKQLSGGVMDDNMLNMMFAFMDTNSDQLVSWAECYAFALANENQNGYRGAFSFATKDEECNLIMSTFDTNNDGFLSFYEVKELLTYSYGSVSDADVYWFINYIDTNGDGKISRSELYNALE